MSAQVEVPARRIASADTKCARLRAFMAQGQWYSAAQLRPVGGDRFPARLHEIARGADGAEPMAYDKRTIPGTDNAFRYRLRPYEPGEERPGAEESQAARIARLEAALAAAEAELARLKARKAPAEPQGHLWEAA